MPPSGLLAGVALQLSKHYGRNLSSVSASPGCEPLLVCLQADNSPAHALYALFQA